MSQVLSADFEFVPPGAISIARDTRQRRTIDTSGLKDSIQRNGVLNPLIVTRDLELVAGERRLTACLELGLASIPIRYLDSLDPIERSIIELEENLKRSDLDWRDQTRAVGQIHALYQDRDPAWTQQATAKALSMDPAAITRFLRVYPDLASPKIAICTSYASAYNMLIRIDSRKADNALADILESGAAIFNSLGLSDTQQPDLPLGSVGPVVGLGLEPGTGPEVPSRTQSPTSAPAEGQAYAPRVKPLIIPPQESILNDDFLKWAPGYAGPKFNFIHCDFPYGIGAFDGSQGAAGAGSSSDMGAGGMGIAKSALYDDTAETYWALVECLANNLDRLMAHAGHLMFWFGMEHYSKTLELFQDLAPSLTFTHMPLIWVKSDNRGILPDAKRGPRQIYETCLFASREDRFIVKSVSNAYAAPTDKTYHHSTKPEPVLRHFFQMFVDDTTSILDPTCGSGSALRAAESLGARHVLGLELDPEHCENARTALRKFRVLRSS